MSIRNVQRRPCVPRRLRVARLVFVPKPSVEAATPTERRIVPDFSGTNITLAVGSGSRALATGSRALDDTVNYLGSGSPGYEWWRIDSLNCDFGSRCGEDQLGSAQRSPDRLAASSLAARPPPMR